MITAGPKILVILWPEPVILSESVKGGGAPPRYPPASPFLGAARGPPAPP
jgi:hypothetical protein